MDFAKIKEQFAELSVLVVGDHCLDRDCIGEYSGQSNENEALSIFQMEWDKYRLGGAANVASSLARLGLKTTVAGTRGYANDYNWVRLSRLFATHGIDIAGLAVGIPTATFEKYYLQNGQHIWRSNGATRPMDNETEERLTAAIIKAAQDVDFIVVADYDETGNGVCTERILRLIAMMGKPTFGTSRKRIANFKGFDNLILSESEWWQALDDGISCTLPTDRLTVTAGEEGAMVFVCEAGRYLIDVSTRPVEDAVDSCGCGDAFLASFASAIMAGHNSSDAARLGNATGRVVAQKKFGVYCPSLDEIEEQYKIIHGDIS